MAKIKTDYGIKRWDVLRTNNSWEKALVVKVREKDGSLTATIIPLRKPSKYKLINKLYRLWLKIRYL